MPVFQFKKQNYDKLKSSCLKENKLFVDDLFPANEISLFKSKRMNVEWKRPHEICQNPRLVVEGLDTRDVIQGQLGNCWFVAASSTLSIYKNHWARVIPDLKEQEFDPKNPEKYAGIFKFCFWQFGNWIEVVIDDLLPTRNNRLLFTHSSTPNEFWSSLLEKAYAKLYGCYEHLDGGNLNEALQDFTGGVVETIKLENDQNKQAMQHDTLFETIKKSYERKSLMTCAINSSSSYSREEKMSCGLYKGHAYAITKCTVMVIKGNSFFNFIGSTEKLHMIRLRNPWGSSEWSGKWSDKSEYWNKVPRNEREKMGLNFDDDGEFWMEFRDFLYYFDEVSICRIINTSLMTLRKTWSESSIYGEWKLPGRAGGCVNYKGTFCDNPQYIFELNHNLDKPDEVLFNLDQMGLRSIGRNNLTIGFFIMKVEDNRKYRIHQPKPRIASSSYINSRSVFLRQKLENGRYIIIPSTFEPQIQGQFLLRIYSDENNNLKEIFKECPTPLCKCNPFSKYASCITSLIVKSGFNLKNQDSNGIDTFVVLKCESKKVTGNVVKNNSSPEWNTSAVFYRYKQHQPILIEVWIKRAFKNELYGDLYLDAEPNNRHIIIESSLSSVGKSSGKITIEVQSMSNITAI